MRAVLVACCIGVVLGAGSLRAETPEAKACKPRAGEKNGVRFVEVCGAGVFISAAPLVCTPAETESAACDPMTALESSPLPGPGKNRHADVLMAEADRAERLCQERLGGRLPTPRERELARSTLGLVSLQVREEPGDYARLRLDELPEWVAEDGRVTRSLAVAARPRVIGEVLLGCVAEPALPHATAVSIGEVCDERPLEADVRSPNCALALPGAAARFELGCDPAHPVPSRARPDHAAVRCVLPESELRFPQAVGGSPPAP